MILAIIGVVVTVAGLVATVHYGRRHFVGPQEAEVSPTDRGGIPAIRQWRRSSYPQAVECAQEYVTALERGETSAVEGEGPQPAELGVWGVNALLTAAAHISRYSQGKANYWVVSSRQPETGEPTLVRLRSFAFVGPFPLWQLRDDDGRYRNMRVSLGGTDSSTAIGMAAQFDRIQFRDVRKDEAVSDRERSLGTTHILAIPTCVDLSRTDDGDPVGISIDLRLSRLGRWFLFRREKSWAYVRLMTRARSIQEIGRRLAECPGTRPDRQREA